MGDEDSIQSTLSPTYAAIVAVNGQPGHHAEHLLLILNDDRDTQ